MCDILTAETCGKLNERILMFIVVNHTLTTTERSDHGLGVLTRSGVAADWYQNKIYFWQLKETRIP